MWAAALDVADIILPYGISNLQAAFVVGVAWGLTAKLRGRWL